MYEVRQGASSPQIKFWDTLFISEINRSRKLKVGTLVVICVYRYKNLSARGVWGNQELPLFILGPPPLISPKLIELES